MDGLRDMSNTDNTFDTEVDAEYEISDDISTDYYSSDEEYRDSYDYSDEEFLDNENALDFSSKPSHSYIANVHTYLLAIVKTKNLRKTNPIASARIKSFLIYLRTLGDERKGVQVCKDFKREVGDLLEMQLDDYPVYSNSEGLTEQELDRLPRFIHKSKTPAKCCVCVNELKVGDEMTLLEKCAHTFHSNCISSWLKRSNQCPICRSPVHTD